MPIHHHHALPYGNLVPCDSPHLQFPTSRRMKPTGEYERHDHHGKTQGLSAIDISRAVEVDKLTLRPNGITMTDEELVSLAYELRNGSTEQLSAQQGEEVIEIWNCYELVLKRVRRARRAKGRP